MLSQAPCINKGYKMQGSSCTLSVGVFPLLVMFHQLCDTLLSMLKQDGVTNKELKGDIGYT